MSYSIIVFKNKIKKKILKKFKNFDKAKVFFDKKIKSRKKYVFERRFENGDQCNYELGLVGPYRPDSFFFKKDSMGKNLKIFSENKDFSIIEIEDYPKEEKIYDFKNNKKISFEYFCDFYLKQSGLKIISKLNNKIIYQKDDDFLIFSLKNSEDCARFFYLLQNLSISGEINDFIMVSDFDLNQKKYLYDLLEKNGFTKDFLYRNSTTYSK
jgi:hypothetical protein